MARIQNAYVGKCRALLLRVGARKLEKGVAWYLQRADEVGTAQQLSPSEALELIYQKMRRRMAPFVGRPTFLAHEEPTFVCDVGLGGLARWLRASGYMSWWRDHAGDVELIEEARRKSAILLTTDSGMMERGVLRDGEVPALWLSPGLTKMQQLESVLSELELPLQRPRCMKCGGELERVDKESLAARIPPRTYRWLDEYFLCHDCGKLFWYGTHWDKIRARLQRSMTNVRILTLLR